VGEADTGAPGIWAALAPVQPTVVAYPGLRFLLGYSVPPNRSWTEETQTRDQLAANPFLTVKGAAKRFGVAFTTAQRAVAKLEELSIITEISRAKRDRVYCARALLDILEEPARLTSMEV